MKCEKHGDYSVFCRHCDIETIAIAEKAEELFLIYSKAMNAVKDTYCNKFEYLEQRSRLAWLEVARQVIKSDKSKKI
jgi:hypothetical protein